MAEIKIGFIGTDTGHVHTFAQLLNKRQENWCVDGGRVVAAWKGGSPDLPSSVAMVDKYAGLLPADYEVKMLGSIKDVAAAADAIMLESLDGRAHLAQFRELAGCGKPVFIDKPFTCALADAREIQALAARTGTPVFSTSGLRYHYDVRRILADREPGDIVGAEIWGMAAHEAPIDNLFWYGIHGAEMLFALLGKECEAVRCVGNADTDIVVGRWSGNRLGVLRGIRKGQAQFGGTVFRDKAIQYIGVQPNPDPKEHPMLNLLLQVLAFFRTGQAPVPVEETVQVIAFLEAANRSRADNGREILC